MQVTVTRTGRKFHILGVHAEEWVGETLGGQHIRLYVIAIAKYRSDEFDLEGEGYEEGDREDIVPCPGGDHE